MLPDDIPSEWLKFVPKDIFTFFWWNLHGWQKTKQQLERDFNKKYNWNEDVVAIRKNGSFSKVWYYDEQGNINIITPKPTLLMNSDSI